MKRNIFLLFLTLALALILAYPIGNIFNSVISPWGSGFSTFSLPSEISDFANGLPLIYLMLVGFLFGGWGKSKKLIWFTVLCIPVFTLAVFVGKRYFFLSLVFFVCGILLAQSILYLKKNFTKTKPI